MEMVTEILCAVGCLLGLSVVGWWLMGRLLRPIPRTAICAVIPGRGEGDGLEQTVRALAWLRGMGLLNCPVLIADAGLTSEGRETARCLARRWPGVELCSADELERYIPIN